jgi:hypothetical protein
MKKKYIRCLFFVLFFSYTAFSQTLTPFVTEGNTWRLEGQIPGYVFIENWKIQGDTIFSGISYKNIFRDNILQGFVRQKDKLVYFKIASPNQTILCDSITQEMLLYDFNVIGIDTMSYSYCQDGNIYELEHLICCSDTTFAFGATRKVFGSNYVEVIEEVGSMFSPLHKLVYQTEGIPQVVCFNNTPRGPDYPDCLTATFNLFQLKDHYWYNNPVEDKLKLHTTQILAEAGYKIYIYDNVGRLIFASQAEVRTILYEQKINAPDGLYYLVLKSKLGVSAGKFFLQN